MKEKHIDCIYMYINKINNKKYVGQCKCLERRIKEHLWSSKNINDKSYNYPLHKALRKYGEDSFVIVILKENLNTECLMDFWEYYYINKYNSYAKDDDGYNIAEGGNGGSKFKGKTEEEMNEIRKKMSDSSKDKKHSEETKKKISNSRKGIQFTEEHKNKLRKPKTDEHKKKLSEAKKGNKQSEETKKKIRDRSKGINNSNYGKGTKVAQYDLNGNLIKVWNSVKEIYTTTEFKRDGIIQCSKGLRDSYKGYRWKIYNKEKNVTKVEAITKDKAVL